MRYNSPAFLAWQEAEQLAAEAERKLFAKLCDPADGTLPTQDEVKETRALRENASLQMKMMLDQMRILVGIVEVRHSERKYGHHTRNQVDQDSER